MKCLFKTNILSKIFAVFMALVLIVGGMQWPAHAEGTTEILASWDAQKAVNVSGQIAADKGAGALLLEGGPQFEQTLITANYGVATKGWSNGSAWVMKNLDATDFSSLSLSAKLRSSDTGPKNFKVLYSIDGGPWTAVTKADGVTEVKWEVVNLRNPEPQTCDLSAVAGSKFSLRIEVVGNTSVKGETIKSTGVSNYFLIEISGIKDDSSTGGNPGETPAPEETCAKVDAEPKAGEVDSGTTVTLSSATEGATIYYKIGDGEYAVYDATTGITITEDTEITAYASKDGMTNSDEETFAYTVKATDPGTGEPDTPSNPSGEGEQIKELQSGDTFVIYNPANSKVMTSTKKSTTKGDVLEPVAGTVADGKLTAPDTAAVVKAEQNPETGYWTLTRNEEYLTSGETGSSLFFASEANDYSYWVMEKADEDGGYFLKNANAKYNGSEQYMEYYSNFTTYSKKSTAAPDAYLMHFYRAVEKPDTSFTTADIVRGIAEWAGNADYSAVGVTASTGINGDVYQTNDMKDTVAKYTAVVGGNAVDPYTSSTSSTTGSTSYYMGGKGFGSGGNDYMQFAFSSKGWADMDMSFRMRTSGTCAGSWQLQYSTDGTSFTNFTTGTYAYKYTSYTSGGESYTKEGGDNITDGIAKTSLANTYYVSFTFDIPEGADNADTLYIRFVPGNDRSDKKESAISTSGVVRVDSVVITGSPIISKDICGYVTADPDGSETIAAGSSITLTSATQGATIHYSLNGGEYQVYDPNNKPVLDTLPATLRTYASKDSMTDSVKMTYLYKAGQVLPVKATPNGGSVVKGTEVTLKCDTEGATILWSSDSGATWNEYTTPLTIDSFPASYQVMATKAGYDDSTVTNLNYTERTSDKYSLYFGQIHSHTNYSDGAGSCEDAYQHASQVDNLDYLAVTDHSNSFDNAANASILDGSMSTEWVEGHELANKYTTDSFVCLFGYEMTWSNGLGHMNTFNTNGFQSRTQTDYATYSTALQNYYAALKKDSNSISQFNHPGTTFGDFSDFAYYDEQLDDLITLVEVGNGEGAIGSTGYFPSYEYYQRALDKGWHVAPTNNQDNHKGLWGDANTARTVAMTDSLTQANIYDAMRNYRIYATEDNDLSIYYTLNGYEMGSILSDVGDTANIKAELNDPTDSSIGRVQVVTNGGLILAEKTVTTNNETVEFSIPNNYSYYYLKITETDGDIAVTAPVWVGKVEAAGIEKYSTDEVLPVTNEPLKVDLTLYNNEASDMTVNSVVFSVGDEVVHTVDVANSTLATVPSRGSSAYSFDYTNDKVGSIELSVTVNATLNGAEKQYKSVLKLTYVTPEMVTKVIVDGSHGNDYVTGYYGGNMGNFTAIAGEKNIKVEVVKDKFTAETLKDCALLVVSAPARASGTANAGPYEASYFEDEFLQYVKEYVDNGGSVVVCGLADYQDKKAASADKHASAQLNKLLETIGSTLRINDDEAYDAVNNGGQIYRLYPETFNMDSEWTKGIITKDADPDNYQKYSQYSGCTVDPGQGTWLVKGFDTTYSVDSDKDGVGATTEVETDDSYGYNIVTPKGEAVFLATEKTAANGNVFAAGGVFLSDFEVKASLDSNWDLPYANRTIAENILDAVTVELPVTPIGDVRKAGMGEVFRVEGYVTAGRENTNNAFFDAICVQDETGGITVFPYAVDGLKLGTKVSVTGYVDEYQGEKEIQVLNVKILDDENLKPYDPKPLTADDAMDYETNGGLLVSVTGKVVKIEDAGTNGEKSVNKFWLDDGSGTLANIFIDGYIKSGTTGENTLADIVKEGAMVTAVGLVYAHPEGESDEPVICLRVRNTDEITAESTITAEVSAQEGVPNVTIDNTSEEIVDMVMSVLNEEAKARIENGESAKLIVNVKKLDIEKEKDAVARINETCASSELRVKPELYYYDITVGIQIGEDLIEIHDLNGKEIKIAMEVPESLRKREIVGVIRDHKFENGNIETKVLSSVMGTDGKIHFGSSLFSTYALGGADKSSGTTKPSADKKPATVPTGVNGGIGSAMAMLAGSLAAVLVLIKKRKFNA